MASVVLRLVLRICCFVAGLGAPLAVQAAADIPPEKRETVKAIIARQSLDDGELTPPRLSLCWWARLGPANPQAPVFTAGRPPQKSVRHP